MFQLVFVVVVDGDKGDLNVTLLREKHTEYCFAFITRKIVFFKA